MSDIVLLIDDEFHPCSSSMFICRICHEEEFESCKPLENPCACSGTVKFAHRDGVQRWCDEKGNTTCEICLQNFEPGYISSPRKTPTTDTTVTIRGSLEVPRNEEEEEHSRHNHGTEHPECDSEADRNAFCCKSVALIFTALLLLRHLFAVLTGGEGAYPFSLLTVFIVKASGIILPMYLLIRIISALQNSIRHHYQNTYNDSSSDEEDDEDEEQNSNTRTQV